MAATLSNHLYIWRGHVYDTFTFVKEESVTFFIGQLNSSNPNLPFTYELENFLSLMFWSLDRVLIHLIFTLCIYIMFKRLPSKRRVALPRKRKEFGERNNYPNRLWNKRWKMFMMNRPTVMFLLPLLTYLLKEIIVQ